MTDEPPTAALSVDVLRGTPTDEEVAALIAVVGEAYAGEAAGAVADDAARPSAWTISTRTLRQPMRRELGWSAFGGG